MQGLRISAGMLIIGLLAFGDDGPAFAGGAGGGPGIISFNPKQYAPKMPIKSVANVTARFFDSAYENERDRQHLGVDIGAPEGTVVVSPVYGKVIKTNIVDDAYQSYIVIQDFNTGWEHVIGHIKSDLTVGTTVAAGNPIGTIVTAGTGPHVHWGMNSDLDAAISQGWGWGIAPSTATTDQAISKGWIDPMSMI